MVVSANTKFRGNKLEPSRIKIDIRTLNMLCKYILQDARFIRMEHLVNLRKLLFITDKSMYENDPEMKKRVDFLFKALEARLDNNVTELDLILMHINGGISFKIDFLDYDHLIMNKNDIQYCHEIVEELLKYSFFYNDADRLQEFITEFKASEISNRLSSIKKVEELLQSLNNKFRQCHVEQNLNDTYFSLEEGVFENAVTDTYNMVTNPSRRLLTGMQGFNEMIGGGFESGRVYMFLGVAGVGKSLTLLNIITQLKRHNIHVRAKDPTKKPCIVLLTMENTVIETITRLYDMVVVNSHGMGNETLQDVIYKLRNEGELRITESSPLDIIIRYKANRSVSTDYLYSLYDDLMDQGKEPVCIIQDHIKRIRSVNGQQDIRLELGDVVNEFKVFAADKDIPVITVSHLNREATRILEEASRKGNQDNGRLIGKSNTGESLLMIDNLDCGITLTRDYDIDGLCYMTFHRIKMRDKGSERDYIAQPFLPDNPIRLVEDLGGIPQFKESLHNAELKHNPVIKMSGSASLTQNITDVLELDTDDNAFANKDSYVLSEEAFDDDISQLIIEEAQKQEKYNMQMVNTYQLPSENPPRKMISFVRPMVSFDDVI
jgi:replicative DNA helicase